MKRYLFLAALVALALPATALGKGATKATVSGPGLDKAIVITGGEDAGTPLGDLAIHSGFYPATFGQSPDPMLHGRPKANLGPKFTITYTMPGPNNDTALIRQDVYPYAKPYPVTYTRPGQKFFGTERTRGGWYQSNELLKDTLVDAGLPARTSAASKTSAAASASSAATDERNWAQVGLVALLAALLLALLGGAFLIRRRAGTVPAH